MQLRLTKNIQEAVHAALAGEDFPLKYKEEAEQVASISLEKPSGISLDLLKLIAQYLDRSSVEQDRTWFHELIRGTEVYVEPKEPPPKNPEFEAYMEQLRAQQREKEYAKMVSSVVTSEDDKYMYSLRPNELKEIKGHVTTILNIAFSMVAVYVAVYMAAKTMTQDVGTRVLLSLAGAFMIGIVETILYIKYTQRAPRKKKSFTKRRPKKVK